MGCAQTILIKSAIKNGAIIDFARIIPAMIITNDATLSTANDCSAGKVLFMVCLNILKDINI
jgi:hypothetical protein